MTPMRPEPRLTAGLAVAVAAVHAPGRERAQTVEPFCWTSAGNGRPPRRPRDPGRAAKYAGRRATASVGRRPRDPRARHAAVPGPRAGTRLSAPGRRREPDRVPDHHGRGSHALA